MATQKRKSLFAFFFLANGVLLSGLFFLVLTTGATPPPTQQPIAFPHNIHAGERKIACTYCHRTAETADYAGMPSVELCISCHRAVIPEDPEVWKLRSYWELQERIPWKRVHRLPAHAFFSHKAHLAKGEMGCEPCHGKVETMVQVRQVESLSMGWCLSCHREENASMECWSCHR